MVKYIKLLALLLRKIWFHEITFKIYLTTSSGSLYTFAWHLHLTWSIVMVFNSDHFYNSVLVKYFRNRGLIGYLTFCSSYCVIEFHSLVTKVWAVLNGIWLEWFLMFSKNICLSPSGSKKTQTVSCRGTSYLRSSSIV